MFLRATFVGTRIDVSPQSQRTSVRKHVIEPRPGTEISAIVSLSRKRSIIRPRILMAIKAVVSHGFFRGFRPVKIPQNLLIPSVVSFSVGSVQHFVECIAHELPIEVIQPHSEAAAQNVNVVTWIIFH